MSKYLVYKEGERPWPDEVTWIDEAQLYEAIQEAAEKHIRALSPAELAKFAITHLGLNVDVQS